jgi:hypothetical protein
MPRRRTAEGLKATGFVWPLERWRRMNQYLPRENFNELLTNIKEFPTNK